MNERLNLASIFLVSAGTLAFEVILTRLFALAFWHHFAALLIGLALTGFGAAGSLLVPFLPYLEKNRRLSLALTALAAGLAPAWAYLGVLSIDLEPLALAWSKAAWLDLGLVGAVLIVPFILAAAHLGLVLAWSASPGLAYAFNLAGSGAGCLAAALAAAWLLPPQGLLVAAGLTLAGFLVQLAGLRGRGRLILAGLALVLAFLTFSQPLPLHFEPFKDRSAVLAAKGSRLEAQQPSLDGLIEIIGGPAFHFAPGLSLNCSAELPAQAGLFLDGDLFAALTKTGQTGAVPDFVACRLTGLPHRIFAPKRVLILDPAGGLGLLDALAGQAREIVAVEERGAVARLLAGRLPQDPRLSYLKADAASFIAAQKGKEGFDLVVLGDGTRWEAGAASGQGETRLLTVEGLEAMLNLLKPDGVLALAGPILTPPRASVKLLATAASALRSKGSDPAGALALVRDWKTVLVLIKPAGLSPGEAEKIKQAAWGQGFDLSCLPGLKPEETNRFHRLEGEPIFQASQMILAGRHKELFAQAYFDLRPATRDRPYFFHFFKPKTLKLIWGEGRRLAVTEWGLLFIWGGLFLALILAAAGIFLPLLGLKSRPRGLAFFGLIGLGYMIAEITLLAETIHRLGRPALAVPLVIGVFLVASGAGSRLLGGRPPRTFALLSGLALPLSLAGLRLLPGGAWVAGLSLVPAALVMGAPFAGGLKHLAGPKPLARAWAFGVNGFLSVAGSLAASLVCLQAGHLPAILTAAGCYLLAGLAAKGGEE